MLTYISDGGHYRKVLSLVPRTKHSLWIGTADIKDVYVMEKGCSLPLVGQLSALLGRGVSVRLLHAKEPGRNFRDDFDRYPLLCTKLERRLCPRVHFKLLIFDGVLAYIGSANLTGAGIGMKHAGRRNFEAGILTDEKDLVLAAGKQFSQVWSGACCAECGRREFCPDPIA